MSWNDRPADYPKLLDRCRRGDQTAWTELVERLQSLVYSIPRRHGLNEEDANDVFQATFLALYRSLDRIDNAQTLPKWVAVTAARESYRVRRLAGRYATVPADEDRTLEDLVADIDQSAEERAVEAVDSDHVRNGLLKLGGRCKVLLELLYSDDEASYQEISEQIGMPVGAIGPTRARCLDKLRKILENNGFFAEA
jgi:RNA polymerase sigma factor (sigma-70 family)